MAHIQSLSSDNLSFYRTQHQFERYGEINTLEDMIEYCHWAKSNDARIYILGNGSNTLFSRKNIRTLVLKNSLEKRIEPLPNLRLKVSSSVLVMDVLKHCYSESLDCFYYLASVPATVGGALAMNAGLGQNSGYTIYDFVESVTFFEDGELKTLTKKEIVRGYRETIFTGLHSKLIISVIFQFSPATFENNPIFERLKFVKIKQDNTAPNCGSVFKFYDPRIMLKLRGFSFANASLSSKTANWIKNRSKSHIPIMAIIEIVKVLHLMVGRKAVMEVIKVD